MVFVGLHEKATDTDASYYAFYDNNIIAVAFYSGTSNFSDMYIGVKGKSFSELTVTKNGNFNNIGMVSFC